MSEPLKEQLKETSAVSLKEPLNKTLDHITLQASHLIELCEALKEQNDLLSLENQSLRVALETSQTARKKLDEKLGALKLAIAVGGSAGKTISDPLNSLNEKNGTEKNFEIKQKINEFVREIDKCIILLNK